MSELQFQVTGLTEDEETERGKDGRRAPPLRAAGWALLGIAVLALFGIGRIEITSPATGTATLDAQIAVSGRATDPNTKTVTLSVNGSQQTLPAQGGFFEVQVSLAPGENIISASANGYSSDPITVVRRQQPVIRISSPSGNTATTQNEIEVTGVVENSGAGVITFDVNGATKTVGVMGERFSTSVPLAVGRNVIRALLPDAAPAVIEVARLLTGIAITSPSDGFKTEQETVTVTGMVDNPNAPAITLELNESRKTIELHNGSFTADIALRIGENRMRAVTGEASSNEIVVTRTLPAVIITLSSPQSGSTQSSVASVRGTIQNPRRNNVDVNVNGSVRAAKLTGGTFATEAPLQLGHNVISASQDDAVSNEVVINRLPLPTLIVIIAPQNGQTQRSSLRVAGTIANPRGQTVTLTVNDSTRNLPVANGRFASDVSLAIGDNHIRALQGDAVSNEVVVNRRAPPTLIEITSPKSGRTRSSSVKVIGTVANPQGRSISLAINDSSRSVEIIDGGFALDVELAVGDNRIRASQGAAVSNEVIVNRLSSPTSIQIFSPKSGRTNDSSVTVAGSIVNPRGPTITLTVNGSGRNLRTINNSFSTDVQLDVGDNRIQASQADAVSNEVMIRRLPTAPTIRIIWPRSGRVSDTVVTVTGQVKNAPGNMITITVNGISKTVQVTNGRFKADVILASGNNLIEASVPGAADRITVERITPERPESRIYIISPKDGTTTRTRVIPVTGRVENIDSRTVTVTVNGKGSQAPTRLGEFRLDVRLSPGRNSIRASLGRLASREVTVTLTDEAPNTTSECSRIDCDCKNLRASVSLFQNWSRVGVATANTQPPFLRSRAGSQRQSPQAQCLAAEETLKRQCKATGRVTGTCPPGASGPKAWPQSGRKRRGSLMLPKGGVKTP